MKHLISDLHFFLKKGELRESKRYSISQSIRGTLGVCTASYMLNIILVFIVQVATSYLNILIPENETMRDILNNDTLNIILKVTIIAPIFEEIIFRINLKYSTLNLSMSLTVITYLLTGFISDYVISIWSRLIISFFLWIIFYVLLENLLNKGIKVIWDRYSIFLLYISILSFGLSHIFNYPLSNKLLIYIPLITLPQTISGISLAYIRIKYGIAYSILLHSTSNTISLILGIILVNNT